MPRWKLVITDAAKSELIELPTDMQGRFLHVGDMLESLGPERVREPHVRPLEKKLWEMRFRGKDGIARAIYFAASGRQLVVVRAFVKKTQKTPRREIDLAHARMKEFLENGD